MCKWTLRLAVIALSVTGAYRVKADDVVLAENGRSSYRIVIAADTLLSTQDAAAPPSTQYAAAELQHFLKEITGVELPIVGDNQPAGTHEILLGDNAHLRALNVKIDRTALGREGYVLRTVGPHLIIAGGEPRGTLYGVYGLLDDHFGCRWFTPEVSRIPRAPRLAIASLDEQQIPVLEYREPFTFDCFDGAWCARNRVNSQAGRLEERHGGKVRFGAGFFVHTFATLVPPDKHFQDHPEYFSLVGGQRQNGYAQLCCTNEDVVRLCTEGILAAMRAQPDAFVFSVSQNDTDKHCECDACQALARQEESQIAPVLQLVNRVAEAVEKEFPDKAIETLAYQWTRRPPKQMRPRPNVIIRLCSIECCFAHPLGTCDCPANQAFCRDLEGWSKVSQRLWIWDYVTNFANYLLPFPNQRVRNDNIRLFIANHVTGIFEQDTYETPHSELAALGGYLTARFLWNPQYDEETAMTEFLTAYYGPAAATVREYIDLLHDKVERENIHVMIYVPVTHPHLSDDLLAKGDALWQQAEQQAAGDVEVLRRVKLSRMSVDYAIVERARAIASQPEAANAPIMLAAKRRFAPFMETLGPSGLTNLREGARFNHAAYRQELAAALGIRL